MWLYTSKKNLSFSYHYLYLNPKTSLRLRGLGNCSVFFALIFFFSSHPFPGFLFYLFHFFFLRVRQKRITQNPQLNDNRYGLSGHISLLISRSSFFFSRCLSFFTLYFCPCFEIFVWVCLSVRLTVLLSVCLFVCFFFFVCLSDSLSVCLSVHLSLFSLRVLFSLVFLFVHLHFLLRLLLFRRYHLIFLFLIVFFFFSFISLFLFIFSSSVSFRFFFFLLNFNFSCLFAWLSSYAPSPPFFFFFLI